MRSDGIKLVFTYTIVVAVLAGTFYALILSPYTVADDVKLWLTGAAGSALTFVFGEQVSMRTARQSESSSASGAAQALSTPTVTVTQGPPQTTTVSPSAPVEPVVPVAPLEGEARG